MKFNYRKGAKPTERKKVAIIVGILVIVFLAGSAAIVRSAYQANLKPLSSSNYGIAITIDVGSKPADISEQLKAKGVIKSDWAFEWYVRNHNLTSKLKAGTYLFRPSQSVPDIVEQITEGKIAKDLVTILPARRLDQIRADLIKAGFSTSDVNSALDPKQYTSYPALVDKPADASLEGYLYPESFQKTAQTSAKQIVKQSLDEMQQHLTPEIRQAFNKQGLTVHQGIILASIVEKEVGNSSDRNIVAQVFLKRYHEKMTLGSDVTAFYGAIIARQQPSVSYDSPYNTRIRPGLPPGPISNVSESSIQAVAFPAQTDWLYFVAGDDGKTYFSKTLEEHNAQTKEHCIKLCQ